MTKQHRKFSRKISVLCHMFNSSDIDVKEFNLKLKSLLKTSLQIGYIV